MTESPRTHESQAHRPSRLDRRGAWGQGRPLEAVDEIGLPDRPGGRELGLIASDFARRVGADSALLAVVDGTPENVEVLAASGAASGREGLVLAAADGFVGRVLSSEHAVLGALDPAQDDSLSVAASGTRLTYAAGAALRPPRGPMGALCAGFSSPPIDLAMTAWIVESCARLASLCLSDRGGPGGLLAGTQRDALTGCLDYAAIRHEMMREVCRSERHGLAVSCCFIDVDRFKRVNDRYGHLHGNQVLANLAAVLRAAVRCEDTLGRYGGDEFVLLLPVTDETAAVELAERLRLTITTTMSNLLPHDPIGASIGVAQWQPGSRPEDMLAAADQALLAVKTRGGGAVTRASGLIAATTPGSAEQHTPASSTTELRWVRFCGYCAHRPNRKVIHRVCAKCGLGVLVSASVDTAPSSHDAFLILDEHMIVGALSKHAQSLLGVSENSAVDRHIDDFLTPADSEHPPGETLTTAFADVARSDTTGRDLAVHVRTSNGDTIPLRARVGPCGPPGATLIVLTDTT